MPPGRASKSCAPDIMLHVAIGHSEGIHTDAVIGQVLGECAAQLGWMKTAHELPRVDRFPE